MRNTVYFLAFDGFADWHAALALCEIRRPGDWQLRTVGFSMQPVLSMAGVRVLPELTLDELDIRSTALLILPGGHLWERRQSPELIDAVAHLHQSGATIAAIDSAVLVLAHAGLLEGRRHTASWPGQVALHLPRYSGEERYDTQALAVSQDRVITASHLGSVEFAREVIRTLDLYSPLDREHWYRMFKHATPPPWLGGQAVA
ncbi:MAG TPA: DJ-1/PfpI family protein [Dyella sp.]|uniref:DJ-1/PfpI family protein n=1 Tax=Dyella sp. TaxID=1869338 RepID=UPI002F93C44A